MKWNKYHTIDLVNDLSRANDPCMMWASFESHLASHNGPRFSKDILAKLKSHRIVLSRIWVRGCDSMEKIQWDKSCMMGIYSTQGRGEEFGEVVKLLRPHLVNVDLLECLHICGMFQYAYVWIAVYHFDNVFWAQRTKHEISITRGEAVCRRFATDRTNIHKQTPRGVIFNAYQCVYPSARGRYIFHTNRRK